MTNKSTDIINHGMLRRLITQIYNNNISNHQLFKYNKSLYTDTAVVDYVCKLSNELINYIIQQLLVLDTVDTSNIQHHTSSTIITRINTQLPYIIHSIQSSQLIQNCNGLQPSKINLNQWFYDTNDAAGCIDSSSSTNSTGTLTNTTPPNSISMNQWLMFS